MGDGQRVFLSVVDTGRGMSPDLLEQVFEAFTQAPTGLERSDGGLGLGLALAKGLVELHDGSIRAHSDGLGQGARMEVSLPLLATA